MLTVIPGIFPMTFAESVSLALRCLFFVAVAAWPVSGGTHELRPTIATVEFKGHAEVELAISLNLEAAIAGIGAGHEDTSQSPAAAQYDRLRSLPPLALGAEFARFTPSFLHGISLGMDGERVPLEIARAEIPETGDTQLPRISLLTLHGPVPAGVKRLNWHLDPRLGDSVIRLRDPASEQIVGAEFVVAGETSTSLLIGDRQPQSRISIFATYVKLGFTHIVPKGPDHILFVVGLFLLATRWRALIGQVTAFTIAHSVTLALAMIGIVRLSPAVVEPLIAASIVYVAVENILTSRVHPWRLVVVFCFGLLHGLGFAAVLREIGPPPGQFVVSLVAFNVGVELGQLVVVSVCFLAFGWSMKRKWYRSAVVIPASLAIGLVAVMWVAQRTVLE